MRQNKEYALALQKMIKIKKTEMVRLDQIRLNRQQEIKKLELYLYRLLQYMAEKRDKPAIPSYDSFMREYSEDF